MEFRIDSNSDSETSGPSWGPEALIMNMNEPRGTIRMRERVLNCRPSALATVYFAFIKAAGIPPTFISRIGSAKAKSAMAR